MGRSMTRALALALALAMFTAVVAVAKPDHATQVERFEAGNLVAIDHGGITPETLPRHQQAAVTANLHAKLMTKDGTHLPAVDQMSINFDRTLQLNAKGLPSCSAGQLRARSTGAVKRICGGAIVGSGTGEVEVAFPEQAPFRATGPLVAFNGGVHGKTTLLFIHTYIDVPAPTAVVVEARITRIHSGHFGMNAEVQIPRIAGGAGSVTRFDLNLGRRFTYRGKPVSYITASCPTGSYRVEGHLGFSDGTVIHITHLLPCTPVG